MNVTQVSITSISMQSMQSIQGNRHHNSLGEMVSKMQTRIGNASDAGKLDSNLADALIKKLEEILKELRQGHSSASNGLSSDDRQNIRKELKAIGDQFFQAIQAKNSVSSASDGKFGDLLKALDPNGDGKIDKSELSDFVSRMTSNGQGTGNAGSGTYCAQGSMYASISIMQARFSVTA